MSHISKESFARLVLCKIYVRGVTRIETHKLVVNVESLLDVKN